MSEYYNWFKTFTYDADITMVVGARGFGKTFGLRWALWDRWEKGSGPWAEVTRTAEEIKYISAGYLDKLSEVTDTVNNYDYKVSLQTLYGRHKNKKNEEWKPIVYFRALSQQQRVKKQTHVGVNAVVFDEAILETRDVYHRYLPDEYELLAKLIDSVTRERPDSKKKPHIYLLGNALDLVNPYFMHYKIFKTPKFGKHWYGNKTFLLDYVESREYSEAKALDTVAGRMLAGSDEGVNNIYNEFEDMGYLIGQKPKGCYFAWALKYKGNVFSMWTNDFDYFVETRIPKGCKPFVLFTADKGPNLLQIKKTAPMIKDVIEMQAMDVLRFKNIAIAKRFLRMCDELGYH